MNETALLAAIEKAKTVQEVITLLLTATAADRAKQAINDDLRAQAEQKKAELIDIRTQLGNSGPVDEISIETATAIVSKIMEVGS